jgi:uncharacterized protein YndB with AHSA1/START domain
MSLWNKITNTFAAKNAAGANSAASPAAANSPELVITRVFDCGRHKVWDMWTKPDKIAEWWGVPPLAANKESTAVDMRVGGIWQADMINTNDGTSLPFRGTFVEVDPPRKIVIALHDPADANNPNRETLTVTFTDHAGSTQMTLRQKGFLPPEQYGAPLQQGYGAFLDRMSRYLRAHQD